MIGSGGSVIRGLVEETGAKIDISDDGTVKIAAASLNSIKDAINRIKMITSEPEVGQIYKGKVVKIVEFGAFVNFFGARDGLVHISQMADRRLKHASEILKEGSEVYVKVMGFDDRGKVRLVMKGIDQKTGKEVASTGEPGSEQPAS